jgi:hypothetical protein
MIPPTTLGKISIVCASAALLSPVSTAQTLFWNAPVSGGIQATIQERLKPSLQTARHRRHARIAG